MRETSAYDGLLGRKDSYRVIEDREGFGVRNVTQGTTLGARWTQYRYALNWKFCLIRFRWRPLQRKKYAALKMASTRLKVGISAADFAREWFIPYLKEKHNPDMTDADFHEDCVKRARTQLRKYAKQGVMRCEPRGPSDKWFIEASGVDWLKEVDVWLETRKRHELKER